MTRKTWSASAPEGEARVRDLELFERFSSSIATDIRLARFDIRASQVHAQALEHAGIISAVESRALQRGLSKVLEEIDSGTLPLRDDLEDIHTHVEGRLSESIGPLAGALHAGRSRNDQIATDQRLLTKQGEADVALAVCSVIAALVDLAERNNETIMPGYTHMQRGQPILVAHYLLAHVEMLTRDLSRLEDSWARADECPLGSGALAGSSFPLDRAWMAQQLGFARPTANSLDSVADRDFVADFMFLGAQLMVHLSRLAEDLIIWASSEFSFVVLPQEFTSGSSMMPQKRNPDTLELVRGKSGHMIGELVGVLAMMKGLPMSYDRDLQEATGPLLGCIDTLVGCLETISPLIQHLEFNTDILEEAASGYALATDLADQLVRSGVPFREAHRRVSRLVNRLVGEQKDLDDVKEAELTLALYPEGDQHQPVSKVTPHSSVESRRTLGSTNPSFVEAAVRRARQESVEATKSWKSKKDLLQSRLELVRE